MAEKILFRGAEAKIILKNGLITKRRSRKSYRLREIDEKIRGMRTRSESRLMERASMLVPVPKVLKVNEKKHEISMDFVRGKKLSDCLDKLSKKEQKNAAKKIGKNIAKLHDSGIIHGDLTTSNMILKNKDVFFIDFGLGFFSRKVEDKAVDIYLLKEALESKHFKNWNYLFSLVKDNYKISKNSKVVLERLKRVESRGRYKEKY